MPAIPLRTDKVDLPTIVSRLGDSVALHIEEEVFFPPPWLSPDGLDHRVMDKYRLVGVRVVPDQQKVELMLNSLDGLDARLAVIA